jgi:mannose-6-phosphate isomerase-like protein (cupin superfamily)
MKGFITKIETDALDNTFFRKVLYTSKHCQLVVMCLLPQEDIGMETHMLDQFIRCESGAGTTIVDGIEHDMTAGTAVLIPAGTQHNVINTSAIAPMKLYTMYAPPNHLDGVIHKTKADAEGDTEHFDGKTTEPL